MFQRFQKGPTLLKNLKRVRPFFRRVRPFQEGRRGFFKRGAAFWAAAGVLMLAGVGGTLALNGFFGGGAAIPEDTMTRGLAGYWSFDEGDGAITRDASGNNNHGTLTNGPQWTKGKNGGALQFDGKDDYVDCGSTSSLNDISGVVSVEAWARLDNLRYNSIVNKRTGNVEGHWDFRHYTSGLQFVNFDSGGNPKIITAAATFDNDWHHLIVVATDSEVKIYMDGKRLTTTGAL
ncbi:MAG: LamG-like jellyroll fold domain-containing protein, partial [Minisyncoccales bacterium]